MKINSILNKNIILIYDAKIAGKIVGVTFCKGFSKIKNLQVLSQFEEKTEISCRKIRNFYTHSNNLLANNSNALKALKPTNNVILGKNAFNLNGEYIGKVIDAFVDNFYIKFFICDTSKNFSPFQILYVNEVIIIKNEDEKIFKNQFTPRKKKIDLGNIKVSILNQNEKIFKNNIVQKITATTQKTIPTRFVASNLIGKKCLKDISSANGEILIKKGEIISPEKLEKVRLNGKLNELFSKTGTI